MAQVKRRHHRISVLPLLIIVLLAFLAAGSVWYIVQQQQAERRLLVGESGATAQGDITQGIVEVSEDGKTDPDEKGQQEKIEGGKLKDKDKEEEKVVSESEETKPEEKPISQGVVPESEKVDLSYFDDAVFIGDSLTQGLDLYSVLPNASYIASQGINPQTIQGSILLTDGRTVLVKEELMRVPHKKIYVMLGSNGIAWMSKETITSYYEEFLDMIQQLAPDSLIYVQSILPVTAQKSQDERYANKKIVEYNQALEKMAEEQGVYYLNVHEGMRDQNGALPPEASPSDGMHMTSDYYRKWVDYLATHTIPVAEEKPEKSEPVESEPQPQVQKFSEEEETPSSGKLVMSASISD